MVEAATANTARIDTIASNAKTRATQRRYANTGDANTPATNAARPGANTLTSSSIARSAANNAHTASARRDARSAREAAYALMADARTSADNAKEARTTRTATAAFCLPRTPNDAATSQRDHQRSQGVPTTTRGSDKATDTATSPDDALQIAGGLTGPGRPLEEEGGPTRPKGDQGEPKWGPTGGLGPTIGESRTT